MATAQRDAPLDAAGVAKVLLFCSVSAGVVIAISFATDSMAAPVVAAFSVMAAFHFLFGPGLPAPPQGTAVTGTPKSEDKEPPASDAVTKDGRAPPASSSTLTKRSSAAASSGTPSAPSTSSAPSAPSANSDAASTTKYLDAQGVSPGARAMAAAMRAKASRAAAAQAAAGAALVQAPPTAAPGVPQQKMVVLYGSQTGNAAEIAKGINAEAVQRKLPSSVYAMSEFSMDKLREVSVAVFVVSSTGDGDAPENCERMVGAIQRKSWGPTFLSHLQYTVCGLGDSNYTRFMHVPRIFMRRLPEMGAKPFYKCCEADEVDGLEDIVDAWTADLWEPLTAAVKAPVAVAAAAGPGSASGAPEEDLEKLVGVAPLQPCGLRLLWQDTPTPGTGTDTLSPSTSQDTLREAGDKDTALYSAAAPFSAPVVSAQRLSAEWSDRVVIHVDLSLPGWQMQLPRAGDSVGVLPKNDPELVEALLRRLGADPDREFVVESGGAGGGRALGHIPAPCTLRRALTSHCDITGVAKKGLLRVLAEYCSDKKEKHVLMLLSSRGGKEKYKEWIVEARPGLVDILTTFPSCKPDLAHLLEALPALTTRFYSLCCSPSALSQAQDSSTGAGAGTGAGSAPPVLSFAFSLVRQQMPGAPKWVPVPAAAGAERNASGAPGADQGGRLFKGVCTNWMEQLLREQDPAWVQPGKAGTGDLNGVPRSVPRGLSFSIYPRSGGNFSHPGDLSAPVIMIGPGTGVAPFRGFLQEREVALGEASAGEREERGESWLFFGCRRRDEDFLYREDLEGFVQRKVLSRLVVAHSRAEDNQGAKVYVQHKMEEHSKDLFRLLFLSNTHIFVCGDGADMAKSVHAALLKIAQLKPGFRESDAVAHMANMVNQGRYIRDVWS